MPIITEYVQMFEIAPMCVNFDLVTIYLFRWINVFYASAKFVMWSFIIKAYK